VAPPTRDLRSVRDLRLAPSARRDPGPSPLAAGDRRGGGGGPLRGDWHNANDWLPETFRATTPDDVLTEAKGRGKATVARIGYLAEWSHRFDMADALDDLLPARRPVVYLGPREEKGRWANRWRLYDSLLPNR
jgi:hypothetical protein